MSPVGDIERKTQQRVVQLFQEELEYTYLGDWQEREGNSNVEEKLLAANFKKRGYDDVLINKAIRQFKLKTSNLTEGLYKANKEVYDALRGGESVKRDAGSMSERVHLIDWKHPEKNDFAIAEEVTVQGEKRKRPDIVLYINGIAIGVLELKRSTVDIGDGIRQNITNQQNRFIQPFFSTIQLVMAGSDSEGLRYGTIGTPEKWYLEWKEDIEDQSRLRLDKYLIKMCNKERLIELLHDFVLFDGGVKKLPRVHQYFGIKAAQQHIKRKEGGIIWHTQGSGKSIVMVLLAKWILENNPNARVAILTDRDELDKQIRDVFNDAGESIHRASSGKDLLAQLGKATPRLLCSLIHKVGSWDKGKFKQYIKELEEAPSPTVGELYVFVDECHRTQSGKLHRVMKARLPNAVFIGFTGTPLLKKDKKTSLEVFGKYIHTYKFNEAVDDGIVKDLVYEARDIDQNLGSQGKVDAWFEAKTRGLNDFQKSALKQKWATMQNVLSSKSRIAKIKADIEFDFGTKARLSSSKGNAILVASSIFEACRYYKAFNNDGPLKGRCAVITSYNPSTRDVVHEDTGANTETDKEFIYNLYEEILKDVDAQPEKSKTESYEDQSKKLFKEEPANMKLLIVVSKLLTGFDAPPCSYLYIDKSMQDHGLFQAICRVNRLDTEDKQFGYIVDYKNLFDQVRGAISVYTEELDYDDFDKDDCDILMQDRVEKGRERLEEAREQIAHLCEPVEAPRGDLEFIRYFCGNVEIESDLKEREHLRIALYKAIVKLIRAYANIADEMSEAGYSEKETIDIKKELDEALRLREVIRRASGETLDMKAYEADMRHLIDNYIQADDSRTLMDFGDLTLLDIITKSGIEEAIKGMPGSVRTSKEAVAETIVNNVRKKIIRDHLIDPAFFEEMSEILQQIIEERREGALEYEEYLRRLAELATKVNTGRSEDLPQEIQTGAQRALYNNLGKDVDLALRCDKAVKNSKRADFRGNIQKENEIKAALYDVLDDKDEVERIYSIVEEQQQDYG